MDPVEFVKHREWTKTLAVLGWSIGTVVWSLAVALAFWSPWYLVPGVVALCVWVETAIIYREQIKASIQMEQKLSPQDRKMIEQVAPNTWW